MEKNKFCINILLSVFTSIILIFKGNVYASNSSDEHNITNKLYNEKTEQTSTKKGAIQLNKMNKKDIIIYIKTGINMENNNVLFNNSGKTETNIEHILLVSNKIHSNNNNCLIQNNEKSSLNIYNKMADIADNEVISEKGSAYLIHNKLETAIKSEILNINENKVISFEAANLFYHSGILERINIGVIEIFLSGIILNIKNNYIFSKQSKSNLLNNYSEAVLGSEETKIMTISGNQVIGEKDTYFFRNSIYNNMFIKGEKIHIINNIIISNQENGFLFENRLLSIIGSNNTNELDISNNTIKGKIGAYLIYNINDTINLQSNNFINIKNNIFNIEQTDSAIIYNTSTVDLGSYKTKKIEIIKNTIESRTITSLFYNEKTIFISGNHIDIINNEFAPRITNLNDGEKECQAIFKNYGIINIDLYNENPTFNFINNIDIKNKNRTLVGFALINDGKINFTNYSYGQANINLGHKITSLYYDYKNYRYLTDSRLINTEITFEGNNSFNVFLKANIKVNKIILEEEVTFNISSKLNNNKPIFKGVGNNPKLVIKKDGALKIRLDKKEKNNRIIAKNLNNLDKLFTKDKISLLNDNCKLFVDNNTLIVLFEEEYNEKTESYFIQEE